MCSSGEQRPDDKLALSVLSWNILARPFTKHNKDWHRNAGKTEHPSQTCQRYTLAGEHIVQTGSDVVLLQECEAAFFDARWNSAAQSMLAAYDVFPVFGGGGAPGTAILVRKGGRVVAGAESPVCIGGGEDTGGSSKVAAILPVRIGSKSALVSSVHFTWDGMARQRQHHAKLVGEYIGHGCSIVFGGDFNCTPGKKLAELESHSFLGGLQRAELPNRAATGLNGDFSRRVCIDHVYVSSDMEVLRADVLGTPGSPWGGQEEEPATVQAASDHVPVLVELAWR